MTVNNADSTITYTANGSTTQWTFSFPGVDPTFIEVFITDPQGGQIQLDPSLYQVILDPTIDPNPTSQGGKVIYPISGPPLANGNLLTIVRDLPVEQNVSLSNQSIIYPPVVEQEFDYLTLLTRIGSEGISRAFKVGFGDPIPALVPPVAQRAGQQAFFDSLGNLTPGGVPGPGVFVSAAMIPVVEAATIAIARTLLGIYSKAEVDSIVSLLYSTGDLKPTHKVVADPGWVMWSDGTIGNAGSGSTVRANADCTNLFNLYYTYSDALCPLFESTGTATTRAAQGTAATAFGANCRMSLPKGAGRSFGISGAGAGLTNRLLGSAIGAETETPTIAKTAQHQHASNGQLTNFTPPETFVYYIPDDHRMDINRQIPVAFEGGGQPLNIMGPTAYVNVMVKL